MGSFLDPEDRYENPNDDCDATPPTCVVCDVVEGNRKGEEVAIPEGDRC